jgi:hypothetical protein
MFFGAPGSAKQPFSLLPRLFPMNEEAEMLRQELASYRRMLAINGDRTISKALHGLIAEAEARLQKIQGEDTQVPTDWRVRKISEKRG